MLDNYKNEDILFIDIETVSQYPTFANLPKKMRELWKDKMKYFIETNNETASELYEKAGIYAEFGKIICISAGIFYTENNVQKFKVKSFYGHDESHLLLDFCAMLDKFSRAGEKYLCAHNGKEFDFPFIARRCLINGIKLPKMLDIAGKKPWEINHLDTMELWKFGDYKHFTSLNLLTSIFHIPSPKDDISGSDVARVFWLDNDLPRIVDYCQKDVLAVAQLFLRYKGEELIQSANICFTD